MLAHQSQRNHDMSPRGSVYPGRRAHLAPVAGAAGVLATAIAGIFLAFTNSAEPPAQSPPEFDQKSPLTPRSHSPSATPIPDRSHGSFQDAALEPPSWIEAVPSPGASLSPEYATPFLDPGPPASVYGDPPLPPAPVPDRLAPTHGPAASVATPPSPARTAPKRAPKRSAPPRIEVVVPPPASSPTPQEPPQARSAPEPDRRADPPPAIQGGADPCATFHDFRRQPCYAYLNRLTH
jgi:hypothetical protein